MTSDKNINHLKKNNTLEGMIIEFTIPETGDKIVINFIDLEYEDDCDIISVVGNEDCLF